VANAWITAIDKKEAHGEAFNLGSGIRVSVNELVDTILRSLGKDRDSYKVRYQPVRPGDQRHMQADISKIRQALSWSPEVSFEQGMKETIDWAREFYS
jgi:UDP-glucose 4-epimerase